MDVCAAVLLAFSSPALVLCTIVAEPSSEEARRQLLERTSKGVKLVYHCLPSWAELEQCENAASDEFTEVFYDTKDYALSRANDWLKCVRRGSNQEWTFKRAQNGEQASEHLEECIEYQLHNARDSKDVAAVVQLVSELPLSPIATLHTRRYKLSEHSYLDSCSDAESSFKYNVVCHTSCDLPAVLATTDPAQSKILAFLRERNPACYKVLAGKRPEPNSVCDTIQVPEHVLDAWQRELPQ